MKTVDKTIIKDSESLQLRAYLCPAGVWTVGWGHTGPDVYKGLVVTQGEAEVLLERDLRASESAINSLVKVRLSQDQFDALVSLVFNIGAGAFKDSTLLRLLNTGDFEGAAGQFKRWNKSKGKVLNGLTTRRNREEKLFSGG